MSGMISVFLFLQEQNDSFPNCCPQDKQGPQKQHYQLKIECYLEDQIPKIELLYSE